MNRRDALKTIGAGLVTFLVPTPRPRIDLAAWCAREKRGRYEMRMPFELADWTYATDAASIVRVRPSWLDKADHTGDMPPAATLPWDHDRLRGWQPLRKLERIVCRDSPCPDCRGTGIAGAVVGSECENCGGFGCKLCRHRGFFAPNNEPDCPNCGGKSYGQFPSVVKVGDDYWDAVLYERAQTLGGDFVVAEFPGFNRSKPSVSPVGRLMRFRFDGGEGLVMGMDRPSIESRIVH